MSFLMDGLSKNNKSSLLEKIDDFLQERFFGIGLLEQCIRQRSAHVKFLLYLVESKINSTENYIEIKDQFFADRQGWGINE